MNGFKAKQRIQELSEQDSREAYEKISKEEYKALFYAIHELLPFTDRIQNIAAKRFLYYGTLLFNKFNIPSPWITDDEDFHTFKCFLDKLWYIEGKDSGNAPHLEIDKMKWEIYENYNYRDLSVIDSGNFETYINEIDRLNLIDFYGEDKKNELNDKKEKLLQVIYGIKNNTLITKISTRLPYGFTENNSVLTITKNGIGATVTTKIIYLGSSDSIIAVNDNSTVDTQGATRWQNNMTEIIFELNTLIDSNKYVTPIVFDKELEVSQSWNFLFDITFNLIETLWWQLKQRGITTSYWNPTPKDLSFVNYSLWNGDNQIDFKVLQNRLILVKPLSNNVCNIGELNCDIEISWHFKCYQYSKIYADVGQLKESLFWLNVSIEALISKFVRSILNEGKYTELTKGINAYEAAEEIVSTQFPDMKGFVKWPSDAIKRPSVYNLLSKAIKEANIPLNKKEVLAKYSNINSDRNPLFHGVEETVNIKNLQKAYYSYDWLKEKLTPYIDQQK